MTSGSRDWMKTIQKYKEVKSAVIEYLKDHENTFDGSCSQLARNLGLAQETRFLGGLPTKGFLEYITALAGEGYIKLEQSRKPWLSNKIKITLLEK